MEQKIETLFTCINALGEADLNRLIRFVLGIVSLTPEDDRSACIHCGGQHVIKMDMSAENNACSVMNVASLFPLQAIL